MSLLNIQYHRKRFVQCYIILHIISLRSKIGRPRLGKDKREANKEYIKRCRNKNALPVSPL